MGRTPTTFGKYLLEKRFAVGGTSEVYLARPQQGNLPAPRLVIKRLLSSLLEDSSALRMFAMEAKLHHAIHHPNVVEVFESGMVDGEPYLAMAYVEGIDVFRLFRRLQSEGQKLPPQIAVYIARRICAALESVHGARDEENQELLVIHRDVTPSNIYLSKQGDVLLGDFGIARSLVTRNSRHSTSALKGKFNYLAPEQIAGEQVDHRADLFSLAVVMAELILGDSLFRGGGQLATLLMIRDCRIEPLEQAAHTFPPGLFEILKQALSRQPSARFHSAEDLSYALAMYERPSEQLIREQLGRWVHWAKETSRLKKNEGWVDPDYEQPSSRRTAHGDKKSASQTGTLSAQTPGQPPSKRGIHAPPAPSHSSFALAAQANADVDVRMDTTHSELQARRKPSSEPSISMGESETLELDSPSLSPWGSSFQEEPTSPSLSSPQPGLLSEVSDEFMVDSAEIEVPSEPPSYGVDSTEFDLVSSYVRNSDGQKMGPFSYAQLVAMIVTGELCEADEVDFMGEGFLAVDEIDVLSRHLPDVVTAQTIEGPEPPELIFELSPDNLLKLLAKLFVSRETGLLLLDGITSQQPEISLRKEVYIQHGKLFQVSSGESSDLLGQRLVRTGLIAPEELDMALAVLPKYLGRLGDTLLALGLVDPLALFQAIQEQGLERVVAPFTWAEGTLSFYRGIQPSKIDFPLDLDLSHVMLAGVELAYPENAPLARFRSDMDRSLRRSYPRGRQISNSSLPDRVVYVVETLGQGMKLRQLVQRMQANSSLKTEELLRALDVAIHIGMIEMV
jgi:serine/threonine protein kinase